MSDCGDCGFVGDMGGRSESGDPTATLVWGVEDIGGAADTRYIPPGSQPGLASTIDRFGVVAPRDGVLRNFSVRHNTADPAAANFIDVIYTILINGAPTALVLTLATSSFFDAQTINDTIEVPIIKGQHVSLQCTKLGAPLSGIFNIQAMVEL